MLIGMEQWLISWLWATILGIIGVAVIVGAVALNYLVSRKYPE